MIVHRYSDGSEGYQFEQGDRVIVKRTIHGGWFDYGPTHAERCIVHRTDGKGSWAVAMLEIHYSDEWGCATCFPWMLEPHSDTLREAKVVTAH